MWKKGSHNVNTTLQFACQTANVKKNTLLSFTGGCWQHFITAASVTIHFTRPILCLCVCVCVCLRACVCLSCDRTKMFGYHALMCMPNPLVLSHKLAVYSLTSKGSTRTPLGWKSQPTTHRLWSSYCIQQLWVSIPPMYANVENCIIKLQVGSHV